MKSCLSGPIVILFFSCTVSGLESVVHRNSRDHVDLAVFYKQSDADSVFLKPYLAWIGLRKPEADSSRNQWVWSNRQSYSPVSWAEDQPHDNHDCALVKRNKKIYGSNCKGHYFFICTKDPYNIYEYAFIPQSKTWYEAEEYCKNEYFDLASLTYALSIDSTVKTQDFPVWIGLHKDGEAWKWSSGVSGYRNWSAGETKDKGNCVTISSVYKKMATQNCTDRFPFVCFWDNLVLVKEDKTWEEALEHCRSLDSQIYLRYDLVSVQPEQDYDYVMSKIQEAITDRVWVGLRFLAGQWLWVNEADMLYSDLPLCPPVNQRCGALSRNGNSGMEIRDCTERRNFLCYRKY
ncbi:macrophage mannose receptor 1-like [Scomber scombrus]|uniref:Macrophage mannose receptor 1-like n=1 Tax=Scomber scombrus TaxID=13677 RepID=A0AAV1Q1K7_SCOSC